jgi:hypothetical protein
MEDYINGIFETAGSLFILMSIAKLRREKMVKGVDWKHIAFFTIWGFWNMYYYPSLNQLMSFYGGIAIVVTNAVWVCMMIYYNKRQKEGRYGKKRKHGNKRSGTVVGGQTSRKLGLRDPHRQPNRQLHRFGNGVSRMCGAFSGEGVERESDIEKR